MSSIHYFSLENDSNQSICLVSSSIESSGSNDPRKKLEKALKG